MAYALCHFKMAQNIYPAVSIAARLSIMQSDK